MRYTELGFQAVKRGDYQEAVNIFKRALESKQEADTFFGFGLAHYHLGDVATARWGFSRALDLKGDHTKAREYLDRSKQERSAKPAGMIRQARFRAGKEYLEIFDERWKKFFIKGINLGLGLPGFFPGEYAIKEETYFKWFHQMADLGVNAVRIYTIHPPDFYRAFYRFNASGRRLYLFQGIWTEPPDGNDFRDIRFLDGFQQEIQYAVDAVYGNAVLPERRGHAHGVYEYDVSSFTAAFIVGREWESSTVKAYNDLNKRRNGDYNGRILIIRNGTPFETWVAQICDFLQEYELQRYHMSHPVTAVNWPTLDPLDHPSESRYDEEYRLRGAASPEKTLNENSVENEDVESLDMAKITVRQGSGFFALYHAYPYYPDFMNNDYPDENPYAAYLRALKGHHGEQPVLIAEFGVPTSRESAHWHRSGWNHGAHTDVRQGEINGVLIRSIRDAGMAGGILFGWFDEWFKKCWLVEPYERPSERKPFWFNFQDPEENYGLLAAYPGYPGKCVLLAGRASDWKNGQILYDAGHEDMAFRFHDDGDGARKLVRLAATHDEGFLYIRLDTKGEIDFDKAHYAIGLDTSASGIGERMLPFRTNLESPVGLNFVIHLAGKNDSRVLVAQPYDKYLNAKREMIRPENSDQAAWVVMQNHTNARRVSKDGTKFFPSSVSSMSRLTFGSLDPNHAAYNSLSDFFVHGAMIELRIPWGLLNFTDPSSMTIAWRDKNGETRRTSGVRIVALSYKPEKDRMCAEKTGFEKNHTDSLPSPFESNVVKTYTWAGWNTPVYHTYLKKSYHEYRKILASIPESV